MKTSITLIILLVVTAFLAAFYTAEAKELKGRHKEAAVACADCHKSANPDKPAPLAACKDCHGGYSEVKELTKGHEENPHDSHLGEVDCRDCHKMHQPSKLVCESCHNFEMIVP